MPRGIKKENLPSKICVICNRPFTWRKKWERVWPEVTTCSKSCNRKRKELKQKETRAGLSSQEETSGESYVVERCTTVEADGDAIFFERRRPVEDAEITGESGVSSSLNSLSVQECKQDESSLNLSLDTTEVLAAISLVENSGTDSVSSEVEEEDLDPVARRKAQRKAAKKAAKAARRAQREGRGDPAAGNKPCDMCEKSSDLLIRCTYDASGEWKMVCGRCWKQASGGVVDGDAEHPHYRYGGLWKNRRRK